MYIPINNKSGSTAGAVRVEAHPPEHPLPAQFYYNKCITKCLTLKINGHGVQHSQWCHSKVNSNLYKSHATNFCVISYRQREINILNFDLENLGRYHGGGKRDLRRSIANTNLHKSHTCHFLASSHRFQNIHISKFVFFKMQVKVMTCNNRSVASRWQIPDCLSDGNSNVFHISHRLRDIRKSRKC